MYSGPDFQSFIDKKCKDDVYGLFRHLCKFQDLVKDMDYLDIPSGIEVKTFLDPITGIKAQSSVQSYEDIKSCRSYILPGALTRKEISNSFVINLTLKDISLPFNKIFVETDLIPFGSPSNQNKVVGMVAGCLYEEAEPGIVYAYGLGIRKHQNQNKVEIWPKIILSQKTFSPVNGPGFLEAGILKRVMNFTTTEYTTGLRKCKESFRTGREVISDYVIVRKNQKQDFETKSEIAIDWKHRWEVSGHYRKTRGIGKNREGLRILKNMTWVAPHVKGPENMPLVKKERIYSELL